jgi:transcriptional regulator with XRE-family HTH domain
LARQLRQRRKALGVTIQNAAAAAGMSRDTWYRMERGETTVTIGAWFNALAALGLHFGVGIEKTCAERPATDVIPLSIRLADYQKIHQTLLALDEDLQHRIGEGGRCPRGGVLKALNAARGRLLEDPRRIARCIDVLNISTPQALLYQRLANVLST